MKNYTLFTLFFYNGEIAYTNIFNGNELNKCLKSN